MCKQIKGLGKILQHNKPNKNKMSMELQNEICVCCVYVRPRRPWQRITNPNQIYYMGGFFLYVIII